MPTAIKQLVTVGPGGVIELRSPELRAGDQAEVTVVVTHPADGEPDAARAGSWRRFAGAFNSNDPRAANSDRIDADLAAEYGSGLKAES